MDIEVGIIGRYSWWRHKCVKVNNFFDAKYS